MSGSLDTAHSQASANASLYLDALTGVRGFAACWVFLYHAWVLARPERVMVDFGFVAFDATPLFSGGTLGVAVFFVLSGFLLALPFARATQEARPAPTYAEFFRRRALRVLPAYYAQLFLFIPLLALGWNGGGLSVENLALHATMLHNLRLDLIGSINGPYWSMPTEWNFYLLFPLLILFCRRRRWPWLLAGTMILVATFRWTALAYADAIPGANKAMLIEQLPGRLDQFVLGMLGAHFMVHVHATPRISSHARALGDTLFLAGGVALLGLLYWRHFNIDYPDGAWLRFGWSLGVSAATALAILGIALGGRMAAAIFANPLSVWLGVISYSIYLWHFPIVEFLARQDWPYTLSRSHWLPVWAMALPCVLALSAIWYRFVERPFLCRPAPREGLLAPLVQRARANPWPAAACAALLLVAWSALWLRY